MTGVLPLLLALSVAAPPPSTPPSTPPSPPTSSGGATKEATAPPKPMTKREARKLFRQPRGSISVGRTNGGMLVAGVPMPLTGKSFKVFPSFVKRETNWGTREMIDLVKRASAKVRKKHPRSVLGIGNISKKEGGQTGYSVSHKSGRDADLAMYAFNKRGKRINLMSFVKFERDGWDKKKRYRFDPVRNLALVVALLSDPKVQVQYIFVARWLKQLMLTEADKPNSGVDAQMRRRIAEVLWMPSDSNPHHDHFHVRIYCSVQDRLQGCLERGPIRDWVDLGDAEVEAHARKLEQVVAMKDARLRRRALEKLGKIRASVAIGTVTQALNHKDPKTRQAALKALERIGDPVAIPGLVYALKQATDGDWAADILRALAGIGGRTIADVAVAILVKPGELLSKRLANQLPSVLQKRAVRILSRFGRTSALAPLVKLMQSGSRELRRLAHRALLKVTNQPIEREARSTKQLAKAASKWKDFAAKHGGKNWLEWQRLGFVARGLTLPVRLTKKVVPSIIALITGRDDIASANAVWFLSALTGHEQDPAWRSKRNNQRHWRSWWRDFADTLPENLPPAPTPTGTGAPPGK